MKPISTFSSLTVFALSLNAVLIAANVTSDIFVKGKGCGGPAKEIRTREHVYYRFVPGDECTMVTKVSEAGMSTDRTPGEIGCSLCASFACVTSLPLPGWSQWAAWNECNAGCGLGIRNRTRECTVKDALWRTATLDPSKCGNGVDASEDEPCDAGVC